MKDDAKDPYDIKKFAEVVGESRMMIPDSQRRLQAALVDLSDCVQAVEVQDSTWLDKAKEIIETHYKDESKGDNIETVAPENGEEF